MVSLNQSDPTVLPNTGDLLTKSDVLIFMCDNALSLKLGIHVQFSLFQPVG